MADPNFYNNRLCEMPYEKFLRFAPSAKTRRRWIVFETKGTSCVSCGIKGVKVVVWIDGGGRIHSDLTTAGPEPKVREVMITLDHHIPKSKGGPSTIENLNPMC